MFRNILKQQLKKHEGFRSKPYRCTAGKLTIGYGRNLDDVGINEKEAEHLLEKDMDDAVFSAKKFFPLFEDLSDNRKAVICNMIFNLGEARFSGFRSTISLINDGAFESAAAEMLNSKWAQQVKGRARELAELMRKG